MPASIILSTLASLRPLICTSSFLGEYAIASTVQCPASLSFLISTTDIPQAWYNKSIQRSNSFQRNCIALFLALKGIWNLLPEVVQRGRVHAAAPLFFLLPAETVVACVVVVPSEYYWESKLREKPNKKEGCLMIPSWPFDRFQVVWWVDGWSWCCSIEGPKKRLQSDSGFEFGVGAKVIYIKSIFNHLVYLK